MNNKPIIFAGGAIIGAIASAIGMYFYDKKKLDNLNDQLYEQDDYIQELLERIEDLERGSYSLAEDNAEINPPTREDGPLPEKAREEIREKLVRNYEATTNYASMYKDDRDGSELDADELFPDNPVDEEKQATADYEDNKNKPPKIISAEEFSELPSHVQTETLYFWHFDETLVDDNEEIINDPALLIGDALTKYDFIDSDESVIFVMNYATDTAYEIQRVMGSFSEGIIHT